MGINPAAGHIFGIRGEAATLRRPSALAPALGRGRVSTRRKIAVQADLVHGAASGTESATRTHLTLTGICAHSHSWIESRIRQKLIQSIAERLAGIELQFVTSFSSSPGVCPATRNE